MPIHTCVSLCVSVFPSTQLSVPLRDTLLKGTFNTSLKNPLSGDFMKKQGSVTTKGKHAFVLEV